MATTTEEFIAHYGVKGMKWGKTTKAPVTKEAHSEEAAKVVAINSRVKTQKSTKMLSNKELQDAITRMNLEQQYSRMTNGLDKTKKQKAAAFVKGLGKTGKQAAEQQAVNEAKKGLVKGAVKGAAKLGLVAAV